METDNPSSMGVACRGAVFTIGDRNQRNIETAELLRRKAGAGLQIREDAPSRSNL